MSESAFTRFTITPVPKPRQTQADKWKKRPAVMRYRAFADEARLKIRGLPAQPLHIVFVLPMPESWSAKKRTEHNLRAHYQKPDIDNLAKAFMDAIWPDGDEHLCDVRLSKLWGTTGQIWVRSIPMDWR